MQSARARQLIIAQGSSIADLEAQTPTIEVIPEGSFGRVVLSGIGIGPLADVAGAEQLFAPFFTPEGAQVADVYGEGLNTAIVEWFVPVTQAQGSFAPARIPVLAIGLILAIGGAAAATGWFISSITVLLDQLGPAGKAAFNAIAIAGAVLVVVGVINLLGSRSRGRT